MDKLLVLVVMTILFHVALTTDLGYDDIVYDKSRGGGSEGLERGLKGYAPCLKSKCPDQSLSDSASWLYESVQANTAQCKKLVNALCQLRPGTVLVKGNASILGKKISVLFEDHIKERLKEVVCLKEGNSNCYEPHWRHIRWVQRQPLNEALELRNSEKGIEERAKLFGKGLPELNALILGEFGVFKPKSIIRIGYCHGHYLSMKDDTNRLLMATLEDEMGQI